MPDLSADCDTDHHLVFAEVRKKLTVIKQAARLLMWKDIISGS